MNTDRAQLAAIEKAVIDTQSEITRLQAAHDVELARLLELHLSEQIHQARTHDARVTELLKANNALLKRARKAEARVKFLNEFIVRQVLS